MKKTLRNILCMFIALCMTGVVFAAPAANAQNAAQKPVKEKKVKEPKAPKEKKTSFKDGNGNDVPLPDIKVCFDEGVEFGQVTRVVKQEGRSNFVFNDTFLGLYCTMRTEGFKIANPYFKIMAFYPIMETFNDCKITVKNFNFGADALVGLDFKINFWEYLFLDVTPGFHVMYEQTDRFSLIDLGIGANLAFELPIGYNWSMMLGGQFSYDWGNFGTNKSLERYDNCWQKSATLGIKYTGRDPNTYNYLHNDAAKLQAKKDAKKAKIAAAKAKIKAKAEASKAAPKAEKPKAEKPAKAPAAKKAN